MSNTTYIDSKYAYYIEKAENCYIVKTTGFTLLPVVLYCVFWEAMFNV